MDSIKIIEKSWIGIILLEQCNFDCPHCLRIDEPLDPGYKLTYKQLRLFLTDCGNLESLTWIHFSGGEPMLWKQDGLSLVDLLLEVAAEGYTPAFTTNGSYFNNFDNCCRFFAEYLDNTTERLIVWFSIDSFHSNFEIEKGRSQCMENVLRFKSDLSPDKANLLDLRIASAISRDPVSLLPEKMIRRYESRGVSFHFGPLRPNGRARQFKNICPDLESGKPENLGAYARYYKEPENASAESTVMKDRECVRSMCLIGDDYYLYLGNNDPDLRSQFRKIAQLGHLPGEIIEAYSRDENKP